MSNLDELAIRFRILICLTLVLSVWQTVYACEFVPTKFFPSVPSIASAVWQMSQDPSVLSAWAVTFLRAAIGLAIATATGVVLAILSDLSPVLSRGIRYVSDFVQPIPPAALVPTAVFMLGLGVKLYLFVIVLVTVWPPYMNGISALSAVSDVQQNTGRMLGLNRFQLLWHIRLPAALPEIFTGIRYAATISLIAVIVCEMLAGRDGLGFMIYKKVYALRTSEVFALMLMVSLTGVALNGVVSILRRKLVGWHMTMMRHTD